MDDTLIRISAVIPVYRGESSIPHLIEELDVFTSPSLTERGRLFAVSEVILVHDCGPDSSDSIIEEMQRKYQYVRIVWLSRNFGQHAATIAGMSSSTGDWIVTLDEDGQQNPKDISKLIDTAIDGRLQLVYARPINSAPHGWFRNSMSRSAKYVASKLLGSNQMINFNSFRLVDGEIARILAAYCSNGVYLDVGLMWITERIGICKIMLRNEFDRPSGYSVRKLLGHFWRLILTTGTRPLRMITFIGLLSVLFSFILVIYALYGKFILNSNVEGWASMLIVLSFFSGTTLMALGIIAEYLSVTLNMVMGKPFYVITSKPTRNK